MKIVHLIGYYQPELGYKEYYIAKKQKELGHEVHIITSDRIWPFPNVEIILEQIGSKYKTRYRPIGTFIEEGLIVHRLPCIFEYEDFILIKGLKKELMDIRPDIVHAHEPRQGTPALGAFYRNMGYRLLMHIGDYSYPKSKRSRLEYFYFRKNIIKYALENADIIVSTNIQAKNFYSSIYNIDEKIILFIPLGADTSFFHFDQVFREEIRTNFKMENDIVIVFAGKIARYKQVDMIIKAFKNLSQKYNLKLLIIGGGEKEYIHEMKQEAINLNISDKIIFIDFIPMQELYKYFSAGDIGVWPAIASITIIEAMACGLSIVIPDEKTMNHLVDNSNGRKFEPKNINSLIKCLEIIISNEELRNSMRNKSIDIVSNCYSYDIITKKFLDLYTNMLNLK